MKRSTINLAIITVLAALVPAQEFDPASSITLKGNVAGFTFGRPSYLILETKDASGKQEKWAVQGNDAGALMQAGWTPRGTVKMGDTVNVTAYKAKANSDAAAALSPMTEPNVVNLAKSGRLVRGTEVTFSDGKTLTFGSKP